MAGRLFMMVPIFVTLYRVRTGSENVHGLYPFQSLEISTETVARFLGRHPSILFRLLNQISHGDIWQEKLGGTARP